jgi:hypothetical protein
MHNRSVLVKRIIERDASGKLVWNFGLFKANSHGDRQLVAVVEGTYRDAVLASRSDRTEQGYSIKGFKKLKES